VLRRNYPKELYFINMPLISVIIPTYNRKILLNNAINSVIRQTFPDYELIIVDDCSDDKTCELEIFKEILPNIKYIQLKDHLGVSAARNTGVKLSNCQWISFLDSDDIWNKNKLRKQADWHKSNTGCRISQTDEIWVRNNVRVNPPATHKKIDGFQFRENLDRCMITPSSVMMEKKLFIEAGGFNESLPACEDYDLWLRITSKYPVGLINEPLLTRYGGHPDQLSASVFGLDRFRIRSILDLVKKNGLSPDQKKQALMVLVKKSLIVANGYKKRGYVDKYEQYRKIAQAYS